MASGKRLAQPASCDDELFDVQALSPQSDSLQLWGDVCLLAVRRQGAHHICRYLWHSVWFALAAHPLHVDLTRADNYHGMLGVGRSTRASVASAPLYSNPARASNASQPSARPSVASPLRRGINARNGTSVDGDTASLQALAPEPVTEPSDLMLPPPDMPSHEFARSRTPTIRAPRHPPPAPPSPGLAKSQS